MMIKGHSNDFITLSSSLRHKFENHFTTYFRSSLLSTRTVIFKLEMKRRPEIRLRSQTTVCRTCKEFHRPWDHRQNHFQESHCLLSPIPLVLPIHLRSSASRPPRLLCRIWHWSDNKETVGMIVYSLDLRNIVFHPLPLISLHSTPVCEV